MVAEKFITPTNEVEVKKIYGDQFYNAVVNLTEGLKGDKKLTKAQTLFNEYTQQIETSADTLFTSLAEQGITPEMAYHVVVRFLQKYYEAMGDPNPEIVLPKPGEHFKLTKEAKLNGQEAIQKEALCKE